MVIVTGFVGYGEHALDVILVVGLFHASIVPGRDQGSESLELVFLMASVIWWVRRGGHEARSRLVQATKVKGGLKPDMGLGRKIAQVAEILDDRASCPIG